MPTHIISMFRSSNNKNNNINNEFMYNIIKDAENRILETGKRILQAENRIIHKESKILHILNLKYKNKNDEKKYCRLINNKDVQKIVGWYYEFSLGKIDKLSSQLTIEEYNRLTVILYELSEVNLNKKRKCKKHYSDSDMDSDLESNDSDISSYKCSSNNSNSSSSSSSSSKKTNKISCYEKFRINIVRSLEALMKAVQINNDLNTNKKLLESYSDAINTYNDIKALYDRYNKLNEMQKSAITSFLNVNVDMSVLNLKPEYAEYIKKYGFPEGAIFESDKMAEILEKLGNGGNIPLNSDSDSESSSSSDSDGDGDNNV